mmetsp:Transcript_12805/g.25286  ORF Transcript_12805/g.25286 Transcript_12805/m.25286 type:complete len:300 (-) Transcript_12805:87-986(-)
MAASIAQALQVENLTVLDTESSHIELAMVGSVTRAIFSSENTACEVSPISSSPTLETAYHITNALPEEFLGQLKSLRSCCPLDFSRPTVPRRFFQEWSPLQSEGTSDNAPKDTTAEVVGQGRWEREIHYEGGWVTAGLNAALDRWMEQLGEGEGRPPVGWRLESSPFYRILEYTEGGGMAKHSDGNNVHPATPDLRTQATMLVYLSTCEDGGGATSLFRKKKTKKQEVAAARKKNAKDSNNRETVGTQQSDGDPDLIESVVPVRNTVLIFPHVWPHTGCEVKASKKIALRAELYLVKDS